MAAAASVLATPSGAVSTPQNTAYSSIAALYPNLSKTQGQASANILSEMQGELSPETINAIQDEAARFGVSSGLPMSQFAGHRGLRNLGLNVEQTQQQGLQDFLNTLKGYSGTLAPTTGDVTQLQLGQQGAGSQAASLAEQAREFDISHYLQNQQNQLNSYLSFVQ
jgi:hypothetical protein